MRGKGRYTIKARAWAVVLLADAVAAHARDGDGNNRPAKKAARRNRQVTGMRNDAFIKKHPMQIEADKAAAVVAAVISASGDSLSRGRS